MESVEFDSEPGTDLGKSVFRKPHSVGLLRLAAELHPDSRLEDRRKWSCLRERLESIRAKYAEASRRVRILSRYVE
ncbi:MAG: hypothetical protein JO015_02640 [Verrucomicrobia bacterium]|nr:hypothetical protein [Verrucomicrobiota bacterium]